RGGGFRALGWAWVFVAVVIVVMSPRIYYLFPAFPLLFAGGGVAWEMWLSTQRTWLKLAYPVLMIATGAMLAPLAIPVLPSETYIRYTKALHLAPPPIGNPGDFRTGVCEFGVTNEERRLEGSNSQL